MNNWEKELSNLLTKMSEDYLIDDEFESQLKWFISDLLQVQQERIVEEEKAKFKELTKNLTRYETEFTCPCGQEHSVHFLIKKPRQMKGKMIGISINSSYLSTIKRKKGGK